MDKLNCRSNKFLLMKLLFSLHVFFNMCQSSDTKFEDIVHYWSLQALYHQIPSCAIIYDVMSSDNN